MGWLRGGGAEGEGWGDLVVGLGGSGRCNLRSRVSGSEAGFESLAACRGDLVVSVKCRLRCGPMHRLLPTGARNTGLILKPFKLRGTQIPYTLPKVHSKRLIMGTAECT